MARPPSPGERVGDRQSRRPKKKAKETQMKFAATVMMVMVAMSQAGAAPVQIDPGSLSCGALKAQVAQSGAAIVRYQSIRQPGLPLYDRYVRNYHFCSGTDVTELRFVPAKDTANCPLRHCVPEDLDQFQRR
jgi:hypothetical protein